eukprot:2151852-Prymnesium_polylepis.2
MPERLRHPSSCAGATSAPAVASRRAQTPQRGHAFLDPQSCLSSSSARWSVVSAASPPSASISENSPMPSSAIRLPMRWRTF